MYALFYRMPKTLTKDSLTGEVLHQWTISEYARHERGILWYVLMVSAGFFLVAYGIISGNILFALIIILFAIILFLQAHQEPEKVQFAITELGVVVGSRVYTFSEFTAFYIIYEPPEVKSLFLETKSLFRPRIEIPFEEENPNLIRDSLQQFLDEDIEKEQEPLSEVFVRRWKIH